MCLLVSPDPEALQGRDWENSLQLIWALVSKVGSSPTLMETEVVFHL